MPWHLEYTLLGAVTLRLSDKLFKRCPFGHILKYQRVASVVPLTLEKIEVHLDFHILYVLNFDILQGYPLENFLTSHQESLDELLRETTSATATSYLENPRAKLHPEQNSLN